MKVILTTAFFYASLFLTGLFSQTPARIIAYDAATIQRQGCGSAGSWATGQFIGQSNDIDPDTIFLCLGDSLLIDHNGDQVFVDPDPATPPGISYAFYNCPPTITGGDTIVLDDPCLWPGSVNGLFVTLGPPSGDHWFFNSGALITSALFGNGSPMLIHFAPITITDYGNGILEPGCVDVGANNAFAVVYLKKITEIGISGVSSVSTNFGNDCKGKFRLRGGLPEWDFAETYKVDISLAGNPAIKGLPHNTPTQWKHSNDIIFSVPKPGWYEVNAQDGKSCGASFLVNMTGCDASDNFFLGLPSVIAKPGASVCLPMTARNSWFVGTSFSLSWDTAVLQYTGIQKVHPLLKDYQIDFSTSGIGSGKLGIVIQNAFFSADSIPDGEPLMEFCFDVVGPAGASSSVKINASVVPLTNDSPLGDQLAFSVHDGQVVVKQFVAGPPNQHGTGRLSPNPVAGGSPVFLEWKTPDREDLTISICDAAGRICSTTRTPVFPGPNRIEISTAGLSAGCYFLYCRDGSGQLGAPEVLVVWQ